MAVLSLLLIKVFQCLTQSYMYTYLRTHLFVTVFFFTFHLFLNCTKEQTCSLIVHTCNYIIRDATLVQSYLMVLFAQLLSMN